MQARLLRASVPLGMACVLVAPAAARQTTTWAVHREPLPATLPALDAWRGMAIGDFDGDRQLDCVFRSVATGQTAGRMVFAQAVDVYQSVHLLDATPLANDIAAWPDGGFDGTDAFVTVGPAGMHRWTIDANGVLEPQLVVGSLLDAKFVRCAKLTPAGPYEFIVVGADLTTVYRVTPGTTWTYSALPDPTQLPNPTPTWTPEPLRDIEVLDYIGTEDQELALVSEQRLRIVTLGNVQVDERVNASGHAGLSATVFRHKGRAKDQVAYLWIDAPANCRWLETIGAGYTNPAIMLGPLDVVDFVAAELSGDDAPELLLSHRSSSLQVVLANVSVATSPSSPILDQGAYSLPEFEPNGTPFETNLATPACADFDRDGDVDVAMFMRPTNRIFIARHQAVEENGQRLLPIEGPGTLPLVTVYNSSGYSRVEIGLSVPPTVAAQFNWVEVKAWSGIATDPYLSPEPVGYELSPMPAPAGTPLELNVRIDPEWIALRGDPLFLEVRPIVKDAQDEYGATGVVTPIAVVALENTFAAYAGMLPPLYGTATPSPYAVELDVEMVDPEDFAFDDDDPPPPRLDMVDSSMLTLLADAEVSYKILYEAEDGGKKGGINTGGVVSMPNIDPFNPNAPPPPPPRRPIVAQ